MKRIVVAALLALLSASVQADNVFGSLKYMGAELQLSRMKFKGGYGDNSLPAIARKENVFLGFTVSDSFSLEVGFSNDKMKTRRATLTEGDVINGTELPSMLSPAVFDSKIKIKGPYLSLMHNFEVEGTPITFISGFGMSFLKATSERRTIFISGYPGGQDRKLLKRKVALRLTAGTQCAMSEHLFARATLGWVNTRRLIISAHNGIPGKVKPKVKPRDSVIFGLGLGYEF